MTVWVGADFVSRGPHEGDGEWDIKMPAPCSMESSPREQLRRYLERKLDLGRRECWLGLEEERGGTRDHRRGHARA